MIIWTVEAILDCWTKRNWPSPSVCSDLPRYHDIWIWIRRNSLVNSFLGICKDWKCAFLFISPRDWSFCRSHDEVCAARAATGHDQPQYNRFHVLTDVWQSFRPRYAHHKNSLNNLFYICAWKTDCDSRKNRVSLSVDQLSDQIVGRRRQRK